MSDLLRSLIRKNRKQTILYRWSGSLHLSPCFIYMSKEPLDGGGLVVLRDSWQRGNGNRCWGRLKRDMD
jgi:hypothetical protein